jgi:hypothetical protein
MNETTRGSDDTVMLAKGAVFLPRYVGPSSVSAHLCLGVQGCQGIVHPAIIDERQKPGV